MEEEGGGLAETWTLARHLLANQLPIHLRLPALPATDHAIRSETIARRYIQENFEATDWLAVVVRNRDTLETVQRIATAQQIASPDFQSLAALQERARLRHLPQPQHSQGTCPRRTKKDVKEIRHLYLDLDNDGQQNLAGIFQNPAMPHPNYVLQTSPDKYQVVWRVEDIPQDQAEELLRGLARRFGGDPAATDTTRVFRLPGFNNKKYDQDFPVTLAAGTLPNLSTASPISRWKVFPRDPGRHAAGVHRHQAASMQNHRRVRKSERDWAYAIRHLRQGDAPEDIVREIAAYRALTATMLRTLRNDRPPRSGTPATMPSTRLAARWRTWAMKRQLTGETCLCGQID